MFRTEKNLGLHWFAVITALASLGLIGIGGLVTSHGAGMAVPDWPTSRGYNMFALPIHFWKGGVFFEHTHRLWASTVGVLVVFLTRWLGGWGSRQPLLAVGFVEVVAGVALILLKPEFKSVGHFLSGIGGVVLLGATVWTRNTPMPAPLPAWGWAAFGLVQLQGLLGGLRVTLASDQLGIFHATLAQLFLVLVSAIALFTSGWWLNFCRKCEAPSQRGRTLSTSEPSQYPHNAGEDTRGLRILSVPPALGRLFLFTTLAILAQLVIAAAMRHQHAGLAIPDFPLAYGQVWPDTSADAVARYNQKRIEAKEPTPVTTVQIVLQMVHRAMAISILGVGRMGSAPRLGFEPSSDQDRRGLARVGRHSNWTGGLDDLVE